MGSIGCGGEPPKAPETPATELDAGSEPTATTTPAVESHDAAATPAVAETAPPPAPPAPAALALPSGSAKLKVKSKKDFDIELKSDGTVNSGGKAVAKVSGMEIQDPAGKTQLKVDSDGNVTTSEGGAYAKFDGDDLTSGSSKWSIGDDGAFSSTDDKGKKSALGKTEGVGTAKKSALVATAFVVWGLKSPGAAKANKPAASDKPAAGEKPAAEKKPADKKPSKK